MELISTTKLNMQTGIYETTGANDNPISESLTCSLSDARIDAEEIWAEVGNYPINNMSTVKDNQEFAKLTYALALNDNSFVKAFLEIYSTINNRSAE